MSLRNSIPKTGLDTEHLHIYIERINASIEDDPSLAIGSTKELIEATLKTILNGCSFDFDDKRDDIPQLIRKVQKVLKIAPDDINDSQKGADTIKRVLNNVGSVATGIAELRNLYGSGHGKGQKIQGITPRHARLVVSFGTALCSFLLETYEHRDSLKLEHLRDKFSRCVHTLSFTPFSQVRCVAIHPNNNILASGDEHHKLRIWELSTGTMLHEYTRLYHGTSSGDLTALTFSNNGEFIITTGFVSGSIYCQDGTQRKIQILNWQTGEIIDYLPNSLRFDSNRTVVLCPSSDVIAFDSKNKVELYDFSLKQRLKILESHSSQVNSIAFSSDGKLLAIGCDDGQVMAWNWQRSDLSEKLLQISASINSVAINSDNQYMAIGSKDNKIILFNLTSREIDFELNGHTNEINSLDFSPDGQVLASAGRDDTVKLWHVKSGNLLLSIECNSRHKNALSVSFSPDGQALVAGLDGGEIKIWQES